jgi:transcription elongation factor Elf1
VGAAAGGHVAREIAALNGKVLRPPSKAWNLTCPSCEHEGSVWTTLKRLKASNLKCSACGAYLWRK